MLLKITGKMLKIKTEQESFKKENVAYIMLKIEDLRRRQPTAQQQVGSCQYQMSAQ